MEKRSFRVKKFLFFLWTIPLIWSGYLHYLVATTSDLGWSFPPNYLFYIIFGFIYFMLINKNIRFDNETITLVCKLKKVTVDYTNMIRLERGEYRRGGTTPFYFIYLDGNKQKKIRYVVEDFGEKQIADMNMELKNRKKYFV